MHDSDRKGAVISYSDDTLVVTGGAIVDAVESQLLDPTSPTNRHDHWLLDVVAVLSRGTAWIAPLFWSPQSANISDKARQALDVRASELGHSIMSACWYNYGDPLGIDLAGQFEGARDYVGELVRTGAKDASWWACGDLWSRSRAHGEPGGCIDGAHVGAHHHSIVGKVHAPSRTSGRGR